MKGLLLSVLRGGHTGARAPVWARLVVVTTVAGTVYVTVL